jgi:hypothetical protein
LLEFSYFSQSCTPPIATSVARLVRCCDAAAMLLLLLV